MEKARNILPFFINRLFKKISIVFLVLLLVVGLSGCQKKTMVLYQLSNQSHSQMMSYVLKTKDNEIIVIDGGTREDSDYLVQQIKKLSPEGKVKAWFLTHYHKDHTGALSAYLDSESSELNIESIYYQFPDDAWVETNEINRYPDYQAITASLEKQNIQIVHQGEQFMFDEVKVEALRDFNPDITNNAGNNSSIVYKVTTNKSSLLFLGDLGVEGGQELLNEAGDKIENMDYVQVAHHGQAGVDEAVYQKINPKYCLWPTTDWIWDNDNGTGKNTAGLKTEETKAWLEKLNVKKHYIAKDGIIKINIF